MCIPGASTGTVAAIQLGVSAASALGGVASSISGMQNQNAAAEQNAQSARDAYYLKASSINQRIRQERISGEQKKRDASLKSKRARATGKVAAAAGNVEGISVDRLMADFRRSEGRVRDRTQQQTDANVANLEGQKLGARAEAMSRINSVQPAGMENLFGSVVKAGAQTIGAFDEFQDAKSGKG